MKDLSEKHLSTPLQILIWFCIFCSPLLFKNYNESINWHRYFLGSIVPLMACTIFYINYLWLIPQYLIKGNKKAFILINASIILLLTITEHLMITILFHPEPQYLPQNKKGHLPGPPPLPAWFFFIRNFFILGCTVLISMAVKMSISWQRSEEARKKAEMERSAAELKNLRNQINPHFLLNTLNNIYALIEFDTTRAQQAVQELGGLLRYVLYDNQQRMVSLRKEMNFLKTYIELMRIRLQQNVRIETYINIPQHTDPQVAPLIFISLVENAFKHGVSPSRPSFIILSLQVDDDGCIHFKVSNSNFPKNRNDKAGSGIGLQQVKRRLELDYPNRYQWDHEIDEKNNTYTSTIHLFSLLNEKS